MSNPFDPTRGVVDGHRLMVDQMNYIAEQQKLRDNPTIDDLRSIGDEIRRFEATLTADEEIGLILASFAGGATLMHVERVYRSGPRLLVFEGLDGNGKRVRLVQHHSQVTLLLVAAEKLKATANRIQIGFDITPGSSR